MSRLANLPIAARLGAGFGLLALAMLAITLTAVQAFGTFRDDTQKLSDRDVRALAVAGELGQDVQGAAREAVEHLYVYDGDIASQDNTQADVEAMLKQTKAESAELTKLLAGTPAAAQATTIATASDAWSAKVTEAVKRSRQETVDNVEERDGSRTLYVEEISGETGMLAEHVVALQAAVNKGTDATADAVAARAGSTSKMLLIVMGIALLIAIAIAVLITRSVVGPVKALMHRLRSLDEQDLTSLTSGLEAAAAGDFTREATLTTEPLNVRTKDEVGQLAATFDAMLGKADRSIAAYGAMREQLGTLIGEVSKSAESVSAASQQVASSSEEAGRAVGEIAHAVSDVAQGAERQVRMVESTRLAVQEASAAAAASSENATETARAAAEARDVAREGVAAAESATEAIRSVAAASASVGDAIEDLSSRSERIGGIVGTITALAEQTNLLALNAAIEAARAGEQGRGFAVVAEEVRKLAEESQVAAAEISSLIGEMQAQTRQVVGVVAAGAARTDESVTTVEQTRDAFLRIDTAVEGVGYRIAEIATAVEQIAADSQRAAGDVSEVAAVAEQSSASAEQVSASTQETSASTQEIAASAGDLARTAEELNALVAHFKVDGLGGSGVAAAGRMASSRNARYRGQWSTGSPPENDRVVGPSMRKICSRSSATRSSRTTPAAWARFSGPAAALRKRALWSGVITREPTRDTTS